MELRKQVCSFELSKKLDELGVRQDSLLVYDEEGVLVTRQSYAKNRTAAFSVAELGRLLPKNENLVTMFFPNGRCQICLQGNIENDEGIATRWGAAGQSIEGDTEAEARAKMLVYLIKNKLIPAQQPSA